MLEVDQWAKLRHEFIVNKVPIKELARRTGLSRNTVRGAVRSSEPPRYERPPAGSKLDPYKEDIKELLRQEPTIPGQRVRELIAALGYEGGKTILDDYLREVRPFYLPARTFQRTIYLPGKIGQFDLWTPRAEIPVGHGQTRPGFVVVAGLGYSRAGSGTLIFSKKTPELLYGVRRCVWRLGGLPETFVWDRQSDLHKGGGLPTDEYAAFCGRLGVDWRFCAPKDPQAKGVVERLQQFMETSFEPGRAFANEMDFQLQLDAWFDARANARIHETLRQRPSDRLRDEHEVMRPLPDVAPDTDRRLVMRVPPDPYLRFDTCDYSLHPDLVGRRVEVRVTERDITAVALDTGEVACRHARSFARHLTVTAPEHAHALARRRGERTGREPAVEIRPLADYDRLIA